jgi:hypothetical protein
MDAKVKTSELGAIYQIKVTLRGGKPPIWRRIEVSDQITLFKLHRIIQVVMGWTDSHLHQFIIGKSYYGEPNQEEGFETKNEKRVKLFQLRLREKSKFIYEYDFGDSWEHDILIEKILPAMEGKQAPICLKGKRACPPEDIGGTWGYANFLEAISDPSHSDHETLLEWIGGEFDSEAFDLKEVNLELKMIR